MIHVYQCIRRQLFAKKKYRNEGFFSVRCNPEEMISEGITGLNILSKQLCYSSDSLNTETYGGGSTSPKFSFEDLQHPILHPPPHPKIPPPMLRRKALFLIHFSLIHASCFGFLILTALDYSFNSITRETKTFSVLHAMVFVFQLSHGT